MSTEKSDQELPIKEILSYIRRIIANDKDDASPAKPAPTEAAKPPEQGSKPATEPAPAADVGEDDDVLDLTQVVEPGDPKGRKAAVAASTPFDSEFAPELEDGYPDEESAPLSWPSAKPAAAASIWADDDTLVSAATAGRSTDAFARLTRTAIAREPAPLSGSDKTVEAFLVELLRPMLKEWLDAYLDGIVEQVVEQEVKKLARRAELL